MQSGAFTLRVSFAVTLCIAGGGLAVLSLAAPAPVVSNFAVNSPVQSSATIPFGSLKGIPDRVVANMRPNQGAPNIAPSVLPFAPMAPGTPSGGMGANEWSIVPSPSVTAGQTSNILYSVTCVSASDCWAVSHYDNGTASQSLIQRWNGTSWSVVPSPNTSPAQNNILSAVTCVSASDCWAVGYYRNGSGINQTLTQHWDGSSWSIVPSPNVSIEQDSVLYSVTCTSSSDCWAVGAHVEGGPSRTLIQRWNGTSWSIVASPNAVGTLFSFLSAVTCASASDCWAVGYYYNELNAQTLIEHWDGTSWSVVLSPNSSLTQDNLLSGVTCVSGSECWAIGFYHSGSAWQTLIQRWNGTLWTIVTSPNTSASQDNFLYGITCASASDCWAVGHAYNGSVAQTLIERWNGTSWSIVASPNTVATQENVLYGMTCVPGAGCWAVGTYQVAVALYQSLILSWNGTSWVLVNSPNLLATKPNFLTDAMCTSGSDCWAVGHSYKTSGPQTLIERWNGNSWSVIESPNTSATQGNILHAVTCTSASNCWAVGYYFTGSAAQTLIQHWNGTSWSIVASPNTSATQNNVLYDVACASASNCWTTGSSAAGSTSRTLVQRWDGTSWSIVNSPNTSATESNLLNGVTCVSASDCWAIGYARTSGVNQTLVERWDGISWKIVNSPNTSASESNILSGVTCVSASDCWAVGQSHDGTATQTLIERWNGSSWLIVNSPNTAATEDNFIYGVTCTSASNCWTVGTYSTGSDLYRTLIQHWDGASWALSPSPNTSATQNNFLQSVTCASGTDCWAVAYYELVNGVYQTLTMRYSADPPPLPSKVVSRKTHGTAGNFDIDLPLTGVAGIECRTGGVNNTHQVIVTFPAAVTFTGATVTSGTGAVSSSSGSGTTAVTVNLTGVTNAQAIALTLFGVNDGATTGNVSIPMGVLAGDTTANKVVSNTDVASVKGQISSSVTATNFRNDVNANGNVSNTDVSATKAQVSTTLP